MLSLKKSTIRNIDVLNKRNSDFKNKKKVKKVIIIIASVLLVTVIAVFIALDAYGIKRFIFPTPRENEAQMSISRELSSEKIRLENLNLQLTAKENDLMQKETELFEKQAEVDALSTQLSTKLEDIQSLTRLYEKMDSQKSANIMLKYPDREVIANILKNMNKTKAAEILSAMDDDSAAELLQMLLPEGGY